MQDQNTADVKKILEQVKEYSNCKTFRDLAKLLSVKEAVIYSWIHRKSIGDPSLILDKCKGVRREWLVTGEGPMLADPEQEEISLTPGWMPSPRREPRKIPIISWVQAGAWVPTVDPFQPGYAEDFVTILEKCGENTFALKVVGESMEPEFTAGDIVLVDPECEWSTRDYVIVKNGDDEATFKQILLDGDKVLLNPLNPRYPIQDMTGKEFRVVGVVIQKVKKYKG